MSTNSISISTKLAASESFAERKFWLEQLADFTDKSFFPYDNNIKVEKLNKGSITINLPDQIYKQLIKISNSTDTRILMVVLGTMSVLLQKYTGNNCIVIGTTIMKQETDNEFINTVLPVNCKLNHELSFKDVLNQIKENLHKAIQNQNYPMEVLINDLNLQTGNDEFPLFDITVIHENIQDAKYLNINQNLVFLLNHSNNALSITIEYNKLLYNEETIIRLKNRFVLSLEVLLSNPNQKVYDINILEEKEKIHFLEVFNDTFSQYPKEKLIHEIFEEITASKPDNTAIILENRSITYHDLNKKANQLARLLRQKGVKKDTIVGIMVERSFEMIIGLLGILKAGGAYLPIDINSPENRIKLMIEDSQIDIILTSSSNKKEYHPENIILLDSQEIYSGDSTNLEKINNSDNLAYLIYTSGTTGKPKGTLITHKNVVNYIDWASKTYVKGERLNFPLYTSISFDMTVTSVFTPLFTGNSIIIYQGSDKDVLIEKVVGDTRIGIVKATPSHLKLIRSKHISGDHIKRIIVGGEQLETSLAKDIFENFNRKAEIYNEYGPTEATVGCMIYTYDYQNDHRIVVSIGKPIQNTQIYLLDKQMRPVPSGIEGEIYIGGDGLAKGYLFKPELAAEKFVDNVFTNGEKLYKTGDKAIFLPNGNIEFRGRSDQQIKIRGHRIELEEIENKILDFLKTQNLKKTSNDPSTSYTSFTKTKICKRCILPANYPGIKFDDEGVCNYCHEYDNYKHHVENYFKTKEDLAKLFEKTKKTKKSEYDCLLLYSGGKDSSYVLEQLVKMGLKVLAFTYDNGYVSEMAFNNIKKNTQKLGVDSIIIDSQNMNKVFVESLRSEHGICNGCFKGVNTVGTRLAQEYGINVVVSGLSRGQIMEIKLHGLFKLGIFKEEEIEEKLKLFRREYHSINSKTSRLLNIKFPDEVLDNIYFVDYFRYDHITVRDILEYLIKIDKNWIRPADTGTSSSNCMINDVGIYVHIKDCGYHFYCGQAAWECRVGVLSREEGIEEITSFKFEEERFKKILNEIGYYNDSIACVVIDKTDRNGDKFLCAYITADNSFETEKLKEFLNRELPDYMVPAFFVKIDSIPLAPSGKVNRNMLPEPKIESTNQFIAPRNEIEQRLRKVWADILDFKEQEIGIDYNFFELGGHSLKATLLLTAIQKAFNVKIPLSEIFLGPTIRSLAENIQKRPVTVDSYIEKAAEKDKYELSSAQRRLYSIYTLDKNSIVYNLPIILNIKGNVNIQQLKSAFIELIKRHESLRTSFRKVNEEPYQIIQHETNFHIDYSETTKESTEDFKNRFFAPFALEESPILRVGLYKLSDEACVLLIDMHHIISDGFSKRILIQDFLALYNKSELPEQKFQYKDYSEWEKTSEYQNLIKKEELFWIKEIGYQIPTLKLPYDHFDLQKESGYEGDMIKIIFDKEKTNALKTISKKFDLTSYMLLLSITNIFLHKLTGQNEIIISTPVIGRNRPDLERVVGLFVNTLLIRSFPKPEKSISNFFIEIKDITIKAFENQHYPYEYLVDAVNKHNPNTGNLYNVMFVFQNIDLPELNLPGLSFEIEEYNRTTAKSDLSIYATERKDDITIVFEYNTRKFKKTTIELLLDRMQVLTNEIIKNADTKIEFLDFSSALENDIKSVKEKIEFDF
jgi:amino acid adenylation domain-containing protein